jgi:IS5 family transposase
MHACQGGRARAQVEVQSLPMVGYPLCAYVAVRRRGLLLSGGQAARVELVAQCLRAPSDNIT